MLGLVILKKIMTKKIRRWLYRWVILPIFILFVSFHGLVFGLLYQWQDSPVQNSMFMLWHRLDGGTVHQIWVDYDKIAYAVKQAAIASEDAKFRYHDGFDFEGIQTALQKNQAHGKILAGGSTITQQLAKNLFLTSHRSYVRKAEEALITLMIEAMWDKQRILAVYLNVAEFGEGIYGIEAAAQHYFDKSASQLSKEESALLIAMLSNPKYYQQHINSRHLQAKKRIIIKRIPSAKLP